MNKILKFLFVTVILFAAVLLLVLRFSRPKTLDKFLNNTGPLANLVSQYPVKVRGNAMMPIFRDGQLIKLSRHIEDRDNIPAGTVILYERPGAMRLSVIRERRADTNGIYYRVSQEARRQEIDEVRPDRVFAIYNK